MTKRSDIRRLCVLLAFIQFFIRFVSSSTVHSSNFRSNVNNKFKPKSALPINFNYTFSKDMERNYATFDSWNLIKDSLKYAVPCFDTQTKLIPKNMNKLKCTFLRSLKNSSLFLRFKRRLQGAIFATIIAGLIDQDVIQVNMGYKRVSSTFFTASKICLDYKIQEWFFKDSDEKLEGCHKRSSKKLQELFQKNGGIYIKAGQYLSSMDHILPYCYVKRMATLQDQAKITEFEEVKELIKKDFNLKIDDIFTEIDEIPIGSASIGQVHVGQLKTSGQPVAIKIQHPNIEEDAKIDFKTLKIALKLIKLLFPNFDFVWIIDELEESLKLELNFLEEAENAIRSRANFENNGNNRVVIPKVYKEFTSRRVLTMEYCPGIKITDKQALLKFSIDPKEVSKLLYELFLEQIFLHKFLHCDPHPGNIFVAPSRYGDGSFKIILLDHGIYKDLTDKSLLTFSQCYLAIFKDNQEELKKVAKEFNISVESLQEFKLFLGSLRSTLRDQNFSHNTDATKAAKIRSKINSYLSENEYSSIKFCDLPHEFLILFKLFDLLRSTERKLNPSTSLESLHSFLLLNQYCSDSIDKAAGEKTQKWPNWSFLHYWKLALYIYFTKK